MNNELKTILELVQDFNNLSAIGTLTELGDEIEYGNWNEPDYKNTLNLLLDIFFNRELNPEYKKNLSRIINLLIGKGYYEFKIEDFKIIFNVLETSGRIDKIVPAINMLALTFDKKFIHFIERFKNNSDEIIRQKTKIALETMENKSIEY